MDESEFPVEITKVMNCLVDTNRQKITMSLEKKKSTWDELKKEFEFTSEDQSHHLLELTKTGIINRYAGSETHAPYYALTEFGRDLLNGVFNALSPEIQT